MTVTQCDEKIKELATKLLDPNELSKREANAIAQSIQAYKTCKSFLATNPSAQYINTEINRLEGFINQKLEVFDSMYDKQKTPQPIYKKLRDAYEKKWRIPHQREQIHWMRLMLK